MAYSSNTHAMTEEELIAELNDITSLIHDYTYSPAKFGELIGGSIKLDIPKYVKFLQEREKELRKRLENIPFLEESDVVSF